VLPGAPVATTTKVDEDVDDGPPWDVLLRAPIAATTEVDDDVDGGPPWEVLLGAASSYVVIPAKKVVGGND
jgi:hypothetical protein